MELTEISLVSPPGGLFYQVLNQSTVRRHHSLQAKANPHQVQPMFFVHWPEPLHRPQGPGHRFLIGV